MEQLKQQTRPRLQPGSSHRSEKVLGFTLLHHLCLFIYLSFTIMLQQAVGLNSCSLSARVSLMWKGLSNFVPEISPQDTPEIASSEVAITTQELTSQEFQTFSPLLLFMLLWCGWGNSEVHFKNSLFQKEKLSYRGISSKCNTTIMLR